jgi:uncharacterized membrane protein YidH (DUF202 family)
MNDKHSMAVDRTCWAAERTWLAHVRTALAIFIAAFTAYHFLVITSTMMGSAFLFSLMWATIATIAYLRRLWYLRLYE